jgi:hypothetical protein
VERPHRELGAGFADRLGRDYADGFAQFDLPAGGEVAAVAIDAQAVFAFAGQDRTNLDAFEARALDFPGLDLIDLLVGLDQGDLGVVGVIDVVARKPPNNPLAQPDYFIFALMDG